MKNYKESKLKNGLTIITNEHKDSDVVMISVLIKAGSRHETNNERGLTHLLEHMLLKGTKNKPSAFDISFITDRQGAYLNAYTNVERIAVVMEVAKGKIKEMFDLLADIVMNPLFDKKVLENEKKVVLQELKIARDNPSKRLWLESVSRIFKGHPLANYPLGFEETISQVTSEDLKNYYNKFLKPNLTAVIATGAIKHEECLKYCQTFNNWPSAKDENMKCLPPEIHGGYAFESMPGSQTYLNMIFSIPKLEFKKLITLQLISNFLGFGHTSVLYQELRHKLGLVYGISAYSVSYEDADLFYISTSTTNPQQVITTTLDQIFNLGEHFKENLLSEIKEQYINVLLRKLSDPFTEVSFLEDNWVSHQRLITLDEIINTVRIINYKDILELKDKFLTRENLFVMALGEKDPNIEI